MGPGAWNRVVPVALDASAHWLHASAVSVCSWALTCLDKPPKRPRAVSVLRALLMARDGQSAAKLAERTPGGCWSAVLSEPVTLAPSFWVPNAPSSLSPNPRRQQQTKKVQTRSECRRTPLHISTSSQVHLPGRPQPRWPPPRGHRVRRRRGEPAPRDAERGTGARGGARRADQPEEAEGGRAAWVRPR